MSRGKMKPWETYAQDRRARESTAATLVGQHPDLRELRLHLTFIPPDPPCDVIEQEVVKTPDNKAFFEIECPHRECVCGGFNLYDPVTAMIAQGLTASKGRLVCQGWQDTERYGQYHCLVALEYTMSASYHPE